MKRLWYSNYELRITNYELPQAVLVIAIDDKMSDRLEWLGSVPKWF